MSERKPFEGYPESTRQFYAQIEYLMTLNLVAYQRGLFDTLLSDTEDPFSWFRFAEAIPDLKEALIDKIQIPPPTK